MIYVEAGEHPRDTIIREMKEEFGLDADLLFPNPCFMAAVETVGLTAGHIDVGLWFLARGDSSKLPSFDPAEFRSIKWCSLAEIATLPTDKNMGRFLKKLKGLEETVGLTPAVGHPPQPNLHRQP